MSKKYNGADYNIFVLSADQKSKKLLTDMPLNTAEERAVVEKVIRNYALQLGIKYEKGSYRKGSGLVRLGTSPDVPPSNSAPAKGDKPAVDGVPAYTTGKDISINYKGGKINKSLSNYHNLRSVLYHEWMHKKDYQGLGNTKKGASTGHGINHLKVYLEQFKEPGFKNTTQDFKNGMAKVGNELLEAYEATLGIPEEVAKVDALVDQMNVVLKDYGITIQKGYETNDSVDTEMRWVIPDPTITKK
jgi:Metallopeptidase toxin 2